MGNQEFRLDLHTHSIISYDGGIAFNEYRQILSDEIQFVAITDHNEISFALSLHDEFGDRVIVGEEITSSAGEIIGLFLKKLIQPHQSVRDTIDQIRDQGGLVYIPHSFEVTRKGLPMEVLQEIAESIDIIEVFNARSREPWLHKKVERFAAKHNIAQAASSDAHGIQGFGTAFSIVSRVPKKEHLVEQLRSASLKKRYSPFISRFDPLRNKLKKKFNQ